MAAQLLPAAAPYDSHQVVRGSRFGVDFAADQLGSGQIDFWYDESAECALSEQLRRNASGQGWQRLRRVPGNPCDGWRAERKGLTVTLATSATGTQLTIAPAAPDRALARTVTGTLVGAAVGAALFGLLARRRPPAPLLIGTLTAVGLFPGVALTWAVVEKARLTEPVWPVWPALAPLLVPLWLVLLAVGVWVFPRRQNRAGSATATDRRAEALASGSNPDRTDTRIVVAVCVAWASTPLIIAAALLLLFLLAQPE